MPRQNPCPVPGCARSISVTSRFGVCAVHDDQFRGISYYMQQAQKELVRQQKLAMKKGARPGERVSPGGIIIP